MGRVTYGDVLPGMLPPEELFPFGGDRAYKAFALAVGLEMLVAALAGEEHGALLLVARPEQRPGSVDCDRSRGPPKLPGMRPA